MKENLKHKKVSDVHSISPVTFIVGIFSIICCGIFSDYVFNGVFPKPLTNIKSNPGRFIAGQSWKYLEGFTNIGNRVAGTRENEVIAVEYLLNETRGIQNEAHKSQEIEIDHQVVSGGYPITFFSYEVSNIYRNVQNIVVRLAGSSKSRASLMFNCHYDSVPSSPGASDDAANCAIMMEILRVLSQSEQRLKYSIIFLFNGAEETPLQASHGFITQHKWAKDILMFLNLESSGSGGKEILFQAGPRNPWLVKMYSNVPHPSAQVAAEEIFQSGIVPSDTDFRIFRDFGKISGLDFAHNRNGYRYHTKYDSIDYLNPAFMQRTGDNALLLAKNIADSDEFELASNMPAADMVYYDILGFIFVSYSADFGAVLNIAVALIAILIPFIAWSRVTRKPHMKYLLFSTVFGSMILGIAILVSGIAVYFVAHTIDMFDKTMCWYATPTLATIIYGSITLGVMLFMYDFLHNILPRSVSPVSASLNVQGYLNGVNAFWGTLVLISVLYGFRFGYGLMLMLLIGVISNLLILLTGATNSSRKWLIIHFIGQLFVMVLTTWIVNIVAGFFISIMGRSGGDMNPEFRIGYLLYAGTIMVTSYLLPIILLIRNRVQCYISLIVIGLITVSLVCFTNFGFPYQAAGTHEPRVQRNSVTHTHRTFYDQKGHIRYSDSGFLFSTWDRNGHKTIDMVTASDLLVPQLNPRVCRNETYCGLPIWRVRQLDTEGYWLPGPSPTLSHANRLHHTSLQQISPTERLYNFTLTENVMSLLIIKPAERVHLVDWDLYKIEVPLSEVNEYTRTRGYAVLITHGLKDRPNMSFTLKLKAEQELIEGTWLDMVLITHLWEYSKEFTPEFRELLERFPDWTFVLANVANVDVYKY